MCLVRQHNDVRTVRERLRFLELLYERKHVPMIAPKQFAQLLATFGVTFVALCLADGANGLERLGDLLVQFDAVGNHDERPVPNERAEHLLCKEHHRE